MTPFGLSSVEENVEIIDRPHDGDEQIPEPEPDLRTPTRRLLLAVAYDGSAFHGFAPQPRQRTVAGVLATALSERFSAPVEVTCAGRTDTGVHALAQVVHVDVAEDVVAKLVGRSRDEPGCELPDLARALSSRLAPEIVVWSARVAPTGFDARRSALSRRYRYDIEMGPRADPVRAKGCWHVEWPLDIAPMRIAADMFIGSHDFCGFCRQPAGRTGELRRRVIAVTISTPEPNRIRIEIEAQSFCHQMVRSIVGLLVEVGRGRRRPSEVMERLRSGSRSGAPTLAPAAGLCLVAVRYPAEVGGTFI